jgi:ring-1,2-phenylacetyl-CoA epoxidase subunit PaaC
LSLAALPALQRTEIRRALAAYLLSIADDELVIGHRHSEWTGFAPDIESDVALSSIAQEEMGHARLFYERVGELAEGDPDDLAFNRTAEQFRNLTLVERPNGDWGYSIVRLFLYDRADAIRLEALAAGSMTPLADLARTLRREERYHLMYSDQWLRGLANATTDSRGRIQEAFNRAWSEAVAFFEPTEGIDVVVSTGVMAHSLDEQHTQWRDAIGDVVSKLGLSVPAGVGSGAGGRAGRHTDDLRILLEEMTSVWRSEPGAKW